MIHRITIEEYLNLDATITLIDVRTPLEFEQGHIPQAHNIPIFNDEDRAQVGTCYKKFGREQAILLGFDLTGSKWSGFIKKALQFAPNQKITIYCWRGGMRSAAMAWALNLYGFAVYILEGGYKKYRQWVLNSFSCSFSILILGGMTGSRKTELLYGLKLQGEQVIDLEDIAQHCGSAYGSMGKFIQPSQEQFENNLASELQKMDNTKILWLEDESITIGKRVIPRSLWEQMRAAEVIALIVPMEERIQFLMNEYGKLDKEFLIESTQRIKKRLGPEQTKNAILAIEENRIRDFIQLVLVYYDKTYQLGQLKRSASSIHKVKSIEGSDVLQNVMLILKNVKIMNLESTLINMNVEEVKEEIKLTQYSHGAGCGCKISPALLDAILHNPIPTPIDSRLLVSNDTKDDAAVLDLGNGTALISTTDFFMPIVDDAFDFGRIASANAISDVYAMGGKPILAIAILGWPIHKLSSEIARKVLAGARSICAEAGIHLAGGHSIDCPEPIFGLAVNGIIEINNLKKNSTATPSCLLYLTKALGVGILTTAQKKGLLKEEHLNIASQSMIQLNKVGETLGKLPYVKAITDVTGFGLLGHLVEMCVGSKLQAIIEFERIPQITILDDYIRQGCIPGGTQRNWASYSHHVVGLSEYQKSILADPQTSGGLLVAVESEYAKEFETVLIENCIPESNTVPFGCFREASESILINIK